MINGNANIPKHLKAEILNKQLTLDFSTFPNANCRLCPKLPPVPFNRVMKLKAIGPKASHLNCRTPGNNVLYPLADFSKLHPNQIV